MRAIAKSRKMKSSMERRPECGMIVGNQEFSYCMPERKSISTAQQMAAMELERVRRLIW